jgi:hypothetical protein
MFRPAQFAVLSALALLGAGMASAQTAPLAPRIHEAADNSRLVTLRGNTHPGARPEFDRGAVPPGFPLERMQLVLTRSSQQQSALNALLDTQQDRSSPNFHRWLTPAEFGQQFGVADQDIQVITSWLESHGLQVFHVSNGRTIIQFSGTAAQVLETFHTEIHRFMVNGEEHWANSSDPQIPRALGSVVAGVAKLHNFRARSMVELSRTWPSAADPGGFRPQLNEFDGSHALTPADYTVIYNINPLYKAGINGSGVTIGLLGVGPISVQDIADFRKAFSLPKNPPQVVVNGSSPDYFQFTSPDLEGTLDVSWAGAVAPNATVKFIISASTDTSDGLSLSEEYAVDNNVADILSESFGICESDMTPAFTQFITSLREQAAAQGITYLVSSGDQGPYTCYGDPQRPGIGPLSVNALASSPYTIAVGGTGFSSATKNSTYWAPSNAKSTLASALSYVPETAWNDSCGAPKCTGSHVVVAATGGGPSQLFPKPSWQSGVAGIPADGARDVPDVSLAASAEYAPYLLCYLASCEVGPISPLSFTPVGGTSGSAPSFAGVMALIVQKTKSRQGQANPILYRLAAAQQYSKCDGSNTQTPPASTCIFNDVTSGNNAIPGEPNFGKAGALYQAGPGYDLATGLGTVNVTNLVNAWESVSFNPTATSLAINPAVLSHGSAANVQIAVKAQSGSGIPTGDVSLITSTGPNAGGFLLSNGAASSATSSLPGGAYTVTAHYAGDGTFAPSDSAPVPVTVAPEASTTTAGAIAVLYPNAFYSGGIYGSASVAFSARVAGHSRHGIPTGVVTFTDNGVPVAGGAASPVNTEGQALTTNTSIVLPAGQHSIVATYDGDASFLPSLSSAALVTITQAPTAISVQPNVGSAQSGKSVTLTATIEIGNSPFGNPPTGTVTFFSGGQPIGTRSVAFNFDARTGMLGGIAVLSTSALPQGASHITATYSGDANYLGSTSQASQVTVATAAPACTVTDFTADPNPISLYDPAATTTINVNAACPTDIRIGSPSGKLVASAKGVPYSSVVHGVKDGTTYYLQTQGNTTAHGTLQTLTVGVQAGVLPCLVYSFAATPNPIISPTLSGTTNITAVLSNVLFQNVPCPFDIRVGSPSGTLFVTSQDASVTSAGPWVTNGMQFFLQQHGDTTPQGTLATLTMSVLASAPLCLVTDFSANPNPIISPALAETSINVNANCFYDVRIGGSAGQLFFTGGGAASASTGPWVTNGMTFYLQLHGDATPAGTLGTLTVAVH